MHRKEEKHAGEPLFVDGKPFTTSEFTATAAKNEFGQLLDLVAQGQAVIITKHDAPRAVMVSYAVFQALAGKGEKLLGCLRSEFDELLANMQTNEARQGMEAAFDATPKELGTAAVKAAKKRT